MPAQYTIADLERLSQGTVLETLDIRLTEASKERVVATMPVDRRHLQLTGILHGGVSLVLAETVASVLARLAVDDNRIVAGQEINANHLRQVMPGNRLTAEATPFHRGRSSVVAHILIRDEQQRLICVSRCTVAIRDKDQGG